MRQSEIEEGKTYIGPRGALGITPVDGRTARPLWVKGHLEPAGKGYRLKGTAK